MLNKIKWLWKYYRRYPYVMAVLILMTPIQALFQVTIPRMFGFTVDYLQTDKLPQDGIGKLVADIGASMGLSPMAAFGLSFMVIGLIATLLYAYVQCHRAWMNLKLEWLFRQASFDDASTKGPDFYTKFRTGDLVTRMTDDVAEKLSWFACSGIFRFYEALISIVFIVMMMYMIDPILTMWTAGPLPLLILVYFFFSTALDRRYEHLQSRISRFNDVMEACFSGIRVVKAYVREKSQQDKYNEAAKDRREAEISTVKLMTAVDSLWFYIWQFSIVIVFVAGGYMVINSGLSLGSLSVFIYYVTWLVFPMFDVGQFLVKGRQSAVSINRLVELEELPAMVPENGGLPMKIVQRSGLSFEKVDFKFADGERMIIDSVSLDIEPGQTVALVGRVGCGKTWLVNMIPRLVDPSGGIVKLDGIDLRRFNVADLRKNIGYVPQEPVLFSDTVRNNVLFGREEISESVLDWAIEVAQLKKEIESFPKGIETAIGTRGMSISGGQKQRLALARALVGKPKILILDDCTSALDSRTETALWERLHQVMPDMTAILITHRPDTLKQTDQIYVLDKGTVVERGTHDQLVEQQGTYASIYRQYELEEQVNA